MIGQGRVGVSLYCCDRMKAINLNLAQLAAAPSVCLPGSQNRSSISRKAQLQHRFGRWHMYPHIMKAGIRRMPAFSSSARKLSLASQNGAKPGQGALPLAEVQEAAPPAGDRGSAPSRYPQHRSSTAAKKVTVPLIRLTGIRSLALWIKPRCSLERGMPLKRKTWSQNLE